MEILNEKKINAIIYFNNLILNELRLNGINCWIAGGCLRDYFNGKSTSSDCDIFFKNLNSFNKAVNYFKSNGAEIIWESGNAIKVKYKGNVYDLIKIFFKTPNETINNFDLTICMFATDGHKIYHGKTSFSDLKDKKIVLHRVSKPFSTLKRVLKHYKKGFNMSSEETKNLYEYIYSIKYDDELNINGSSGENLINISKNIKSDGFFNTYKNLIFISLGLITIYGSYKIVKR